MGPKSNVMFSQKMRRFKSDTHRDTERDGQVKMVAEIGVSVYK